jgi:hypothetical protein
MLIQDKERGIPLLRNLQQQLKEHSPILLSFAGPRLSVVPKWFRESDTIRFLLKRHVLETGGYLNVNYVHYFTRGEIASEMRQAGFQLVLYSTDSYGHATGITVK